MADRWLPRTMTLAVWALAAWSATYWTLQFVGDRAAQTAPATPVHAAPNHEPADIARVFGPPVETKTPDNPAAPVIDPATRFVLLGVVANRASAGVALLSVDGLPAKPMRVGSKVDATYTLQSVSVRSALLAGADGAATLTIPLTTKAAGTAPSPPRIFPAPAASMPQRTG